MKWKVIGIISVISVAIGIFLIYDDSLVTTSPTDNPAQLAQTSIASENHNTPLGEVSKPSANQAPAVRVGNEHDASEAESWYQLGERYYQEGQLPLSLEAFSHICQTHQAAKIRIKALLKNNRYAIVEEGNIFKSDSLLVLWDKQRRQALNHRLSNCDLD
ncbi:MAG TPA: hypothetical protein ENG03_03280 [Thioploca sp.]|nr:MAG: hypothetical protein B6247_25010 [Beggiatoa sp. 4572_84]RKZ55167.1 MAG: hypothetical protein DRR08_25055 [Gammaproteobacteria bacterium]HDN26116.1 hypothetical protein [Thioploca sp.]